MKVKTLFFAFKSVVIQLHSCLVQKAKTCWAQIETDHTRIRNEIFVILPPIKDDLGAGVSDKLEVLLVSKRIHILF